MCSLGRHWAPIMVAAVVLSLPGCRKQRALQFFDLEVKVSVLVSRMGDDAYEDPAMDPLLAALKAIPSDTVEGPAANALVQDIESHRARIGKERAAAALPPRGVIDAPYQPTTAVPARPPADSQDAATPDAPFGGMPIADFEAKYGSCTTRSEAGDAVRLSNLDSALCRLKFKIGATTNVTYRFANGVLVERSEETRTQVILDGGVTRRLVEGPDAGRVFYVPGGPLPAAAAPSDAG